MNKLTFFFRNSSLVWFLCSMVYRLVLDYFMHRGKIIMHIVRSYLPYLTAYKTHFYLLEMLHKIILPHGSHLGKWSPGSAVVLKLNCNRSAKISEMTIISVPKRYLVGWLVGWVLWQINLCRLFNAESILCK